MSSRIHEIQSSLEALPESRERADLLIELAGLYQSSDPVQALAQAQSAARLSEKLEYRPGLASATRIEGAIHEQVGDYPRSVSCGLRALALYRELGDQKEAGRCLNNIGLAYTRMGALGVALDHFQRALEALEAADDDLIRAYVVNNIGLTYRSLDNNPKALEHFRQSLEILEKSDDRRNVAHALSNIGLCLRTKGEMGPAMEHMRRSLAIRQEIGDRFSQVHSWINIANLHRDMGEHDQSYDCLMKAMDLAVDGGNAIMEVYVMTLLAKLKNIAGELDAALEYAEHAMPLAEKLGDQGVLRSLYQEYADNYEARGDWEQSLMFRCRYFRSQLDLLSTNVREMERRTPWPAADEGGRESIAAGIRRDQIESLGLKASNVWNEFTQMVGHYSAVLEACVGPEAPPAEGNAVEWRAEEAIQRFPEASRQDLRSLWSDLRDICRRADRLR